MSGQHLDAIAFGQTEPDITSPVPFIRHRQSIDDAEEVISPEMNIGSALQMMDASVEFYPNGANPVLYDLSIRWLLSSDGLSGTGKLANSQWSPWLSVVAGGNVARQIYNIANKFETEWAQLKIKNTSGSDVVASPPDPYAGTPGSGIHVRLKSRMNSA